ncbi:TPA: P-type DNA transfer ATPase VirB11 [Legionella pneumophila]
MNYVSPGASGMLSLLSPWLIDEGVSEIMINKPYEVFIEKQGRMTRHELSELSPLYLRRLFNFIANESNQVLDEVHPLLSANLYDGSRVQLAIPPAAENYCLSIRRHSVKHMTLTDYQASSFFEGTKPFDLKQMNNKNINNDAQLQELYQQQKWGEFLVLAVKKRKNIIISGGTSSGKTTFLNALIQEIPNDERLITLEDTREVIIPHENHVALVASKGGQSKAKVTMQDLVQCCLRLRPERIIMGEVRGAEIMDFVSACSTGHEGSITSIHANNPQIAFMRMVQMYKLNNVPSMRDEDILNALHQIIDIIVQVGKTPSGRRLQSCYFKSATEEFLI